MTCIICNTPTKTGDAYMLPRLIENDKGEYVNLVACSDQHRDQWLAENPDDDESPRDNVGECN